MELVGQAGADRLRDRVGKVDERLGIDDGTGVDPLGGIAAAASGVR